MARSLPVVETGLSRSVMFEEFDWSAINVADRDIYDGATELIALFGSAADIEAASRAHASRERGNFINFCRWRRIERFIPVLTCDDVIGTLH